MAEKKVKISYDEIQINKPCDFDKYRRADEYANIKYEYEDYCISHIENLYQLNYFGKRDELYNIRFTKMQVCKDINFPMFQFNLMWNLGEFKTREELIELLKSNKKYINTYIRLETPQKIFKNYINKIQYDDNSEIKQDQIIESILDTDIYEDLDMHVTNLKIVNEPYTLLFDTKYNKSQKNMLQLQKRIICLDNGEKFYYFRWATKMNYCSNMINIYNKMNMIKIYKKTKNGNRKYIGLCFVKGTNYIVRCIDSKYNKLIKNYFKDIKTILSKEIIINR